MNRELAFIGIILATVLFSNRVFSEGTVNLKGKLIEPPNCIINEGNDFQVDFGSEVIASRIDGVKYMQKLNHSLKCENNAMNDMKVRLKGVGADFDEKFLRTSNKNLGVEVLINDERTPLNQWVNFRYDNGTGVYTLRVVPVKNPTTEVSGGAFTATAILEVDYR